MPDLQQQVTASRQEIAALTALVLGFLHVQQRAYGQTKKFLEKATSRQPEAGNK